VFRAIFPDPPFLVRIDSQDDVGIDGTIELQREIRGKYRYTGRRAWFQLKHTFTPQRLTEGSISYPIKTKNINHVGNTPCPFYVLYDGTTGKLLFRWWRDIHEELEREKPGWNQQEEVSIRFIRCIDDTLLKEIEFEIDAYWERARELFDGPSLLRYLRVEQARRLLQPDTVFFGRDTEIDTLIRRIGRGKIVPISGPPDSGKSELMHQCLCQPVALERLCTMLGTPMALLHIDVSRYMAPQLLRALAFALGVHKIQNFESDETSIRVRERAVLIGEEFPARVSGQYLLAFIDGAHVCLGQDAEYQDIDDLLAADPFRAGCAVLASRFGTVPDGKGTRIREVEVRVGALSPDAAETLMEKLGVDTSVVSDAIKGMRDVQELLLPGVIRQGVGTFKVSLEEGRLTPTGGALLDKLLDATERVVQEILMGLGWDQIQTADGAATPFAIAMAMSVLSRQVVCDADLDSFGFPKPSFSKLCQVGWMESIDRKSYVLTSFGYRSLRKEFQRLVRREHPAVGALAVVTQVLEQLVKAISVRTSEKAFDEFGQTLEEAIAWARESGFVGTQVEAALIQALLPYVVDHIFFPISAEEAVAVRDELRTIDRPGELTTKVASLVLAARSDVDAKQFLTCLRMAADAATQAPLLLAVHLRAMDISAFQGQQKYHRYREIGAIRRTLVNRLMKLNGIEAADVGVLKWSASWIMNAATLAIGVGDKELARETTNAARAAIGRLPEPNTAYGASDRSWLESRLAQVESRLQTNAAGRSEKLHNSLEAAFAALANTPNEARQVRFALRAAHRLSEELRNDEDREQLLDNIERRLASIFGEPVNWHLTVTAQVAALARDVAARDADCENRLRKVQRSLKLLEPALSESKRMACLGDNRALLVLARSYGFAAVCYDEIGETDLASHFMQKARELAREALSAAPSTDAWELCIRLVDQQELVGREIAWDTDVPAGPRSEIGPMLSKYLKSAQAWLSSISFWGVGEGRLALLCLQREWQQEGSLIRCAARKKVQDKPWDELDAVAKRRLLSKIHQVRQAALGAIEQKSGPFKELFIARMRNEAQYQRLLAIYSNHVLNGEAVLRHLRAANSLWPDSHALLAEEGRFQRYVWNYPGAIAALRCLIAGVPRGRQRLEAAADLLEVLLTAATHCDRITFADGAVADRAALIAEARTLLTDLLGFKHVSREVSILRDRVDLESGLPVDWSAVDEAFQTVVGDVDPYTTTLVDHLDDLLMRQPSLPHNIGDLVLTHFTNENVLRGLGSLYLRRAELGVSPTPAVDCQRAYAAFLACRVLEIAWSASGAESATTSYQRGKAILVAAKTTRTLTPFQAQLEGKRSLVHLAETLFSRAVGFSVGLFHKEVKQLNSEAASLQRLLGS
jgi:hypothetical protein